MSPTAQQNCVGLLVRTCICMYLPTYISYLPTYLSNGLFEAPTHWSQNKKLVVDHRIGASHARLCMRADAILSTIGPVASRWLLIPP